MGVAIYEYTPSQRSAMFAFGTSRGQIAATAWRSVALVQSAGNENPSLVQNKTPAGAAAAGAGG